MGVDKVVPSGFKSCALDPLFNRYLGCARLLAYYFPNHLLSQPSLTPLRPTCFIMDNAAIAPGSPDATYKEDDDVLSTTQPRTPSPGLVK